MNQELEPFDIDIDGDVVQKINRDGSVLTESGGTFYWQADPSVESHLPSMSGDWVEYYPYND